MAACIVLLKQAGAAVSVNGFEMHVEERGSGEPLLLLHGFGSSGQAWNPFLESLSQRYRVIVPDLRGHGRSTNPAGEFTHRQSAQDIYALLGHLGVRRTKAMGISTGGMTLLHMATSQPERLEAVVLIGATTYFPEQARVIMARSGPDKLTEAELERQRKIHRHGDEQIRTLRQQFFKFKDSYEDMMFTPPYLATIRAHVDCARRPRPVLPGFHSRGNVPVNSEFVTMDRAGGRACANLWREPRGIRKNHFKVSCQRYRESGPGTVIQPVMITAPRG